MTAQSIRLGRFFGIPFGVNYSWFVVFVLITLSLTTQFRHLHPEWEFVNHLLFGLITSLLFFVSILLHELGHSVIALHYKIPVKSITLFIFGGVAHIIKEPEKPSHEFNIAIAGPIISLLLAGIFIGIELLTPITSGTSSLGAWLGYINIVVALFNLIPGFPLDGGRILRAFIWKRTGNFDRATQISAVIGQIIAYAIIFLGVWRALTGSIFDGLWIGFVGWFLQNASQYALVHSRFTATLRGMVAQEAMETDMLQLPPSMSVAELVEHHLLQAGLHSAYVVDGDDFLGLVTLHEIGSVPKERWKSVTLQAVMVPLKDLETVTQNTPIAFVIQVMREKNISQIPVINKGALVGYIGREHMFAIIHDHIKLKT
jgi:Zn-dependent protease/CBS domain-containing protein